MNSRLDKLIACFKELGIKPKVEGSRAFENRIIMQKVTFILEKLGVNLNFDFGFYIRGPYSPDLTKELFANVGAVEKLETKSVLSPAELQSVGKLKKIGLNSSDLEIIATYLFLKEDSALDENTAIIKLKEKKSFFSEATIFSGISKAKALFN